MIYKNKQAKAFKTFTLEEYLPITNATRMREQNATPFVSNETAPILEKMKDETIVPKKKPYLNFLIRLLLAALLFFCFVFAKSHPFQVGNLSSRQIDEKIRDDHFVKQVEEKFSNMLKKTDSVK